MGIVAHLHDWTQVSGGLLCTIAPCTAFLSHAVLQANTSPVTGITKVTSRDVWNLAWKKSGGG